VLIMWTSAGACAWKMVCMHVGMCLFRWPACMYVFIYMVCVHVCVYFAFARACLCAYVGWN